MLELLGGRREHLHPGLWCYRQAPGVSQQAPGSLLPRPCPVSLQTSVPSLCPPVPLPPQTVLNPPLKLPPFPDLVHLPRRGTQLHFGVPVQPAALPQLPCPSPEVAVFLDQLNEQLPCSTPELGASQQWAKEPRTARCHVAPSKPPCLRGTAGPRRCGPSGLTPAALGPGKPDPCPPAALTRFPAGQAGSRVGVSCGAWGARGISHPLPPVKMTVHGGGGGDRDIRSHPPGPWGHRPLDSESPPQPRDRALLAPTLFPGGFC